MPALFSSGNGGSSGSNAFGAPGQSSRQLDSFSQSNAEASSGGSGMDDEATTTYLKPVAFTRKEKAKWKQSNRTAGFAVSPVGGEIASFTTCQSIDPDKPTSIKPPFRSSDKSIYFSSPNTLHKTLLEFYAETYTLFTSLQRIVVTGFKLSSPDIIDGPLELDRLLGPPGAETIGHMSRLVGMYLDELLKLRDEQALDPSLRARYTLVYQILHLSQILFVPADGRGEGLLGEELLDWVNAVDPAPDNRLGNEIMQEEEPWEHEAFWPYLNRCLLRGFTAAATTILRSLERHPHRPIQKLASTLASHLSVFPRSSDVKQFPVDHQFLHAHRHWVARIKAELATTGKKGERIGKDWQAWEQNFQIVIDLMTGEENVVLDEANDWKEAVGAWGILVDVGLRRDDLPAVSNKILEKIPVDQTILDDVIESSLCTGQIDQALISCHNLDIWLTAHLADIFDKLALLPDEERFDMSLRDYFLLEYADMLSQHPAHLSTWRIVASYLQSAGPEGYARLKEYILHIGLGASGEAAVTEPLTEANGDMEMEVEEERLDPKFQRFQEIREICAAFHLDEEWATIGQVMADRLVRAGEFALGATVYVAADNTYGLSRLVDKLLCIYVEDSEEEFLRIVGELPPSLLQDPNDVEDVKGEQLTAHLPIHTAHLAFLAGFRDFLLYRQQGATSLAAQKLVNLIEAESAPIGIRGVLIAESIPLLEDAEVVLYARGTYEIMRGLEELLSHSTFAPQEYLHQLAVYLARREGRDVSVSDHSAALRKLEEVRLASARNLARAMVLDINEF